jgi:tetratricopeptide (TPR) repeat protein
MNGCRGTRTREGHWPLPTRHYLGAALLEAGLVDDARQAFLQDLKTYPDNGWSLFGLTEAERRLGHADAAHDAARRQADAWQWADAPLSASRY